MSAAVAVLERHLADVDILLVEDDPLILETLGEALDEAGLDTCRMASAEQALEVLRVEGPPRVVVTDINLGAGMDGLSLGRLLRDLHPALPLVYISGRHDGVGRLGRLERFLPKPFAASALVRVIEDLGAADA